LPKELTCWRSLDVVLSSSNQLLTLPVCMPNSPTTPPHPQKKKWTTLLHQPPLAQSTVRQARTHNLSSLINLPSMHSLPIRGSRNRERSIVTELYAAAEHAEQTHQHGWALNFEMVFQKMQLYIQMTQKFRKCASTIWMLSNQIPSIIFNHTHGLHKKLDRTFFKQDQNNM
jgi:hypothetical protein